MKKIVNYEKSMGEYTLPDGLREKLVGLETEEQVKFFRTSGVRRAGKTGWTESSTCYGLTLDKDDDVRGIIVDDGIIVGVLLNDEIGNNVPCFINECVCTYSASDNNGAGYSYRDDYTYLVVVE